MFLIVFLCNDASPTDLYPLSLHDALPISPGCCWRKSPASMRMRFGATATWAKPSTKTPPRRRRRSANFVEGFRSEEHTSELQSRVELVCRLLLEKKIAELAPSVTSCSTVR